MSRTQARAAARLRDPPAREEAAGALRLVLEAQRRREGAGRRGCEGQGRREGGQGRREAGAAAERACRAA